MPSVLSFSVISQRSTAYSIYLSLDAIFTLCHPPVLKWLLRRLQNEDRYNRTTVQNHHLFLRILFYSAILSLFSSNMELTFLTDIGATFVVEIDPSMELENVMALLESEVRVSFIDRIPHPTTRRSPQSGVPVADQSIHYQGRELTDGKATVAQLGLRGDKVMLQLRRKVANPAGGSASFLRLAPPFHLPRLWFRIDQSSETQK